MDSREPIKIREIYLVVWGNETVGVCDTYADAKAFITYYDKDEEKGLKIKPYSLVKMS